MEKNILPNVLYKAAGFQNSLDLFVRLKFVIKVQKTYELLTAKTC